jgi:hypothetical protein
MDLDKVRKALKQVSAGEPGELDPAVPPQGGTHDTDIEIADDVVKVVDTNSPNTPDLETRAYEGGIEEDGTIGPPYDGESTLDGIPEIPDTMADVSHGTTPLGGPIGGDPAPATAGEGQEQKNEGGGGPVVQLPDTLEDDLSVAPMDPHASVALTTNDVKDLREIMGESPEANVEKAVKALQWLDRNESNPKKDAVIAGLDKWKPTKAQAQEAQARYGFAYLHTEASAKKENAEQTQKVMAWLKSFLTGRKVRIAAEFLNSEDAKNNPELAKAIASWYKTHAVDQVRENREDVGIEDVTLYGPQNDSPDHRPGKEEDGFTEPEVVSLDDVPFKDPERHPAEAGSEVDEQTGTPAQDSEAVDSDSFSAKNDDRAKEANTPTADTTTEAFGPGYAEEIAAPPVPGMPPEMPPPATPVLPPELMEDAPPGLPLAPEGPGELPELPPVLPEDDEEVPMEGMGPMPGGGGGMPGGVPMAPGADGGELSLEEWLMRELQEPQHETDPAESAHIEMLSNFDGVGQIVASDVVMSLYGAEQENPHWNIDIQGRPVARVELADQPKPEEVRATFLSGPYAENIAQAMEKVGVSEVLQAINAKPYAARIEVGELAKKIETRVKATSEKELAEKVGELRERFLAAAKIALAGYNNNFFRGEDHALKAALWSELKRLGVRDASHVIESAFEEGSVTFFESILAKAEELMDLPDEARDAIAKAIPESNALVTASAETGGDLPDHETLASKLERGNVPFENAAPPALSSRSDIKGDLRAQVKLSEFRSS